MSSEDPFTSVQWDRDEAKLHPGHVSPIQEDTSVPGTPPDAVAEPANENVENLKPRSVNTSTQAQSPCSPELPPLEEMPESASAPSDMTQDPIKSDLEFDDYSSRSFYAAAGVPDAYESGKAPLPQALLGAVETSDTRRMEEQFRKYKIELHLKDPIFDKDPNGKLFISYLIETKTDHPDVLKVLRLAQTDADATIRVRRRYRDFRFLFVCLNNDFPQLLVPPLPSKLNFKYLTGDTFSKSFVHKRQSSLERFVTFICEHKILSQLAVFHYFLSDSSEWGTFTKNLKISKNGGAVTGSTEDGDLFMGKVVNEELLTETVMNFFTSSKHKKQTNKEISEISDKLKRLYENLIKLDKIFARLNKKNNDLKTDYEQFLQQVSRLAAIQISTAKANESGSMDPNTSLTSVATSAGTLPYATSCKVFSESLLYFLNRWSELYQYIDEAFLISLKDCAKYIVKFTDLIELQHNKKIDLQVLQDYLAKARAELESLGGATANALNGSEHHPAPSPALINHTRTGLVNNTTQLIKDTLSTSSTPHIGSAQSEMKRTKLEQRIAKLESEIDQQTKVVNAVTSQIIHEEYPNWDRYNKKQLKQSMVDLCNQEILFYRDLLENWKSVELKLVERLDELS